MHYIINESPEELFLTLDALSTTNPEGINDDGMDMIRSAEKVVEAGEKALNKEGDYFPERYILDFTDGLEYFNTLESAAEYVKNLTGKDVHTEEDITSTLDELEEKELEENEDAFYSFNKFTVLEEDEP